MYKYKFFMWKKITRYKCHIKRIVNVIKHSDS